MSFWPVLSMDSIHIFLKSFSSKHPVCAWLRGSLLACCLTVRPLNNMIVGCQEAQAPRETSSLKEAGNPGEGEGPALGSHAGTGKKARNKRYSELAKHSDSWNVESHTGREASELEEGCDH